MTLSMTTLAVTVEEADIYAELRNWREWMLEIDDDVKSAALRRSQDYIATTYNERWRTVWPNSAAPQEVKFAIIEGAKRELATPGYLSPDVNIATARKRVRVDGAVEVEYAVGAGKLTAENMRPDVAIIDALLKPFIKQGSGVTVDMLRF